MLLCLMHLYHKIITPGYPYLHDVIFYVPSKELVHVSLNQIGGGGQGTGEGLIGHYMSRCSATLNQKKKRRFCCQMIATAMKNEKSTNNYRWACFQMIATVMQKFAIILGGHEINNCANG